MRLSNGRAVVAIDPTSRGLAFVFLEGEVVLDWGERLRRGRDDLPVVEALLTECRADVLVLEDPEAEGCKRRRRIRELLRRIARGARDRNIRVVPVARRAVRQAWANRGVTNKQAMAAEIASRFEELAAVLPPVRKRGANEDPRANIFDAASLLIH